MATRQVGYISGYKDEVVGRVRGNINDVRSPRGTYLRTSLDKPGLVEVVRRVPVVKTKLVMGEAAGRVPRAGGGGGRSG
jgi:hypothetical protein